MSTPQLSRCVKPPSTAAPVLTLSHGRTELARGAKPLIRMQGNQTFIDPPEAGSAQDSKRSTERKTQAFAFDKSYWSAGPRDEPGYCSQQTLYEDLGKELLDHGFEGFNACILACAFPPSLSAFYSLNDSLSRLDRWTDRYGHFTSLYSSAMSLISTFGQDLGSPTGARHIHPKRFLHADCMLPLV